LARIVMKFGGTSMAGTERIRRVANLVRAQAANGDEVAVVVSANGGRDRPAGELLPRGQSALRPGRVRRRRGKRASRSRAGCWRSRCRGLGCKARSWLGWQLPIKHHRGPRQGPHRRRSTRDALIASDGRGRDRGDPRLPGRGSRMAASPRWAAGARTLRQWRSPRRSSADRCDIYTDVDGVYTTDPRIVAKAQKLKAVTYEEMLELASVGAKVLQTRSVGLAMKEKRAGAGAVELHRRGRAARR
jgi:aspartate kinase